MEVKYYRITEDNKALLEQVGEDVFDGPIAPEKLSAYVKESNHIMVVAVLDHVVIGQILAVVHRHPDKPSELYIDDLGVSPQFQRKGIATRLFNEAIKSGKSMESEEIWVLTEPDNEVAKAFYQAQELKSSPSIMFEGML